MPTEDPVGHYLDVSHRIGRRLLSVLAETCAANDVEFYLYAGTLLGSVRQSGWIPWDDDIDVVMFRRDFERFRLVCGDMLPTDVAFSDFRSDPSHLSALAHLLFLDSRKGSYARARKVVPPETVHLHLDIFVLDTTPGSKLATLLWRRTIRVTEQLIHARAVSFLQALRAEERSKALAVTAVAASRCLPSSGWRRLHHEVCALPGRLSDRSPVAMMNEFHQRVRKIIFAEEDFRPANHGSFEGLRVPLPARTERILCRLYGPDFLQPPKDSGDRQPLHVPNGLVATIDGREWSCSPGPQQGPTA